MIEEIVCEVDVDKYCITTCPHITPNKYSGTVRVGSSNCTHSCTHFKDMIYHLSNDTNIVYCSYKSDKLTQLITGDSNV